MHSERLAHWGNELRAGGLLSAHAGVDDAEPAPLPRVVAGQDGRDLAAVRDLACVEDARGEPRVVAVDFCLARSVGVHLEEPLGVDLPAVVVVPAGVDHPAVRRDRWEVGVDLVVAESAKEPSVAVAGEQVAHLGPPAVDRLYAACRVEHEVAVGQVRAFAVGKAQAVRDLPHVPIAKP